MKSARMLYFAVAIISSIIFYGAFQWTIDVTVSRNGFLIQENLQTGTLFFLFIVFGGCLLHLHPRYGGLYSTYRWAFDIVLFIGAIYIPGLFRASSIDSYSTPLRDGLFYLSLILLFVFYIVYFVLFSILWHQKRYALVHRLLDVLQYIHPRNANLYITRGRIFQAQNNFEKMIEAADHAIELTPPLKKKAEEGWLSFKDWRLLNAHNLRMAAYFALDQQEMASEDAEVIVRLNPQEPLSYIFRGIAATQRKDFAAAEADLDYASQLKLDSIRQAYLGAAQADLAYAQHKNEEARSLYQATLDVPLNANQRLTLHSSIYAMLGMIELREGHLEEAQEFYQEAQITNPEFKTAGLALLHAQKGEWDEAVAQWRLVMMRNPRCGNVDSMRHRYHADPEFFHLIEQIIARLEPAA